jgi:hypothetical protein
MTEPLPLVSPNLFVHVMLDIARSTKLPQSSGNLVPLEAPFLWPDLSGLSTAAGKLQIACGWNAKGIGFTFEVKGGKKSNSTPTTGVIENPNSDLAPGIHLWLDTRNTRTINRANRFCHQFHLTPGGANKGSGTAKKTEKPLCTQLPIQNAKSAPTILPSESFQVQSESITGGYRLSCWFKADQLTGYDPDTCAQLSCAVVVKDEVLGELTFGPGTEYPVHYNPSLWQTLNLVK